MRPLRYRRPLLIHTGRKRAATALGEIERRFGVDIPEQELRFGGIVGIVELVDCVSEHPSPWFEGPFGLVLRSPRPLPFVTMPGHPRARLILLLYRETSEMEAAAAAIGQKLLIVKARIESDLETAFAELMQQRVGAFCVEADQFFLSRRDRLVALAARHGLPAIYNAREYVEAGGLMSYGPPLTDAHRLMGIYAGRVLTLKGPSTYACQCLLIGHDQTCRGPALTAEFDPKRAFTRVSNCWPSRRHRPTMARAFP